MSYNEEIEALLYQIGQEEVKEEVTQSEEKHEFSNTYLRKKEALLREVAMGERRKKKKSKRFLVAACIAATIGLSATGYAAVTYFHVTTKDETYIGNYTMKYQVSAEDKIPNVEFTAGYLPNGYTTNQMVIREDSQIQMKETNKQGKIYIYKDDSAKERVYTAIDKVKDLKINDRKAKLLISYEPVQKYQIVICYPEIGHVIVVRGNADTKLEEVKKVADSITYSVFKETTKDETEQDETFSQDAYTGELSSTSSLSEADFLQYGEHCKEAYAETISPEEWQKNMEETVANKKLSRKEKNKRISSTSRTTEYCVNQCEILNQLPSGFRSQVDQDILQKYVDVDGVPAKGLKIVKANLTFFNHGKEDNYVALDWVLQLSYLKKKEGKYEETFLDNYDLNHRFFQDSQVVDGSLYLAPGDEKTVDLYFLMPKDRSKQAYLSLWASNARVYGFKLLKILP